MEPSTGTERSVVFVCLHGAAKSVIAAHHLAQMARAEGMTLECASAGVEPDAVVPPHVVAGLSGDGLGECTARPRQATRELLARADHVVSFGCDLSALGVPPGRVIRWDDVPAVSDGYEAARDAIVKRLRPLLDDLAEETRRA